jgi:hypothetical protein
MSMLTGGCFCGAIRYQATGRPLSATNCHCTMCRRVTGAPFLTWFSVRAGDFQMLRGKPARFNTSEHVTRSFCSRCGTHLTFQYANLPDILYVTSCSLDDPTLAPPVDNIYTDARLAWIGPDGLPDYRADHPS